MPRRTTDRREQIVALRRGHKKTSSADDGRGIHPGYGPRLILPFICPHTRGVRGRSWHRILSFESGCQRIVGPEPSPLLDERATGGSLMWPGNYSAAGAPSIRVEPTAQTKALPASKKALPQREVHNCLSLYPSEVGQPLPIYLLPKPLSLRGAVGDAATSRSGPSQPRR